MALRSCSEHISDRKDAFGKFIHSTPPIRVRPEVRTSGANLGERNAPCFLICMCGCGDGERDVEVRPGEEQAGDEAGARHQNEAARMKVAPPLAVASLAHGDDMRWSQNDNGIDFNP